MTDILSNNNYAPDNTSPYNLIPLGLNINGQELNWNISKKPNALIVGRNGSGKTTFLITLAEHFTSKADMWEMKIVTPTPQDYPEHLENKIFNKLDDIGNLIKETHDTVTNRVNGGANESDGYIALLIDEAFLILTSGNLTNNKTVAQIPEHLEFIAAYGPSVGVHLILSTQRPDFKVFSNKLRDDLQLRVGLAKMDRKSSLIALNSASGTTIPDTPGVGLIQLRNDLQLFKAYLPKAG